MVKLNNLFWLVNLDIQLLQEQQKGWREKDVTRHRAGQEVNTEGNMVWALAVFKDELMENKMTSTVTENLDQCCHHLKLRSYRRSSSRCNMIRLISFIFFFVWISYQVPCSSKGCTCISMPLYYNIMIRVVVLKMKIILLVWTIYRSAKADIVKSIQMQKDVKVEQNLLMHCIFIACS